ncbi:Xylem cysteine proteinase 1, partial [Durusdinium trenchii]
MVKTLKLALGALAFAYAQKPRADVQNAYEQFLKDFGKHYDEVEKQARFVAFAENYEYIERENAQ